MRSFPHPARSAPQAPVAWSSVQVCEFDLGTPQHARINRQPPKIATRHQFPELRERIAPWANLKVGRPPSRSASSGTQPWPTSEAADALSSRQAARAKTTVTQIVEQLHASAPPEAEWIEYFTEGGRPYYYNEASGESRWQCPVPEQMGLELDLATQLGGGGGDLVDLEALAAGVEGSLRRGRDDDDESELDDDEGSQGDSFARRAATARSVGSVGSYGSGVPLTPSVLAKRDELATRDNETRQAREQILSLIHI